jgi:hypothetical protein
VTKRDVERAVLAAVGAIDAVPTIARRGLPQLRVYGTPTPTLVGCYRNIAADSPDYESNRFAQASKSLLPPMRVYGTTAKE